MKLPWTSHTRSEEERRAAERRYEEARGHLRVLLRELQCTLERIEDKRRRGVPGA